MSLVARIRGEDMVGSMFTPVLQSHLDCREIKPINPKGNQPWIFTWRSDAKAETPILWSPDAKPTQWKRPWCWERLRSRGEGGNRGWDGWMASSTQWIWVCANSGREWRTRKPGVLQSMGSQRAGHDQATEQQQQQQEECPLISLGYVSGWVLWSEILTPKVIVFGSGAFGRWLGPKGWDLMNGISALIKGTLERPPALLLCEVIARWSCLNQEAGPHQSPDLPVP